jgi:hypothetical protein
MPWRTCSAGFPGIRQSTMDSVVRCALRSSAGATCLLVIIGACVEPVQPSIATCHPSATAPSQLLQRSSMPCSDDPRRLRAPDQGVSQPPQSEWSIFNDRIERPSVKQSSHSPIRSQSQTSKTRTSGLLLLLLLPRPPVRAPAAPAYAVVSCHPKQTERRPLFSSPSVQQLKGC